MEPVEILVLCILLFIILALLTYIIFLKIQIGRFAKKVNKLLDSDYDEIIKVDMFDRDVVELAKGLNKHVFRQRKLASDYINNLDKLNNLVSGISHDFRTPLTASIGYLQMLSRSKNITNQKDLEYINIALDKNKFLQKLSDDFFDISKMGKDVPRDVSLETIKLSSLLEERILEQYEWINERNITPCVDIDKNISVEADIHDIDRILYNLFSNSKKYAISTLGITLKGSVLTLYNDIADENEIDPDTIFDPFVRGTSRSKEGSGLGLFVVKCLTDEYGFKIDAKVEKKTFTITIDFTKA